MRWQDVGDFTCSIARSLSVVGDRWTLLVLRDAFLRTRRFEDFHAHLGISRHRLADRLRKLVRHGILARVRYQERPPRYEYRLPAKGRDLYPVIVSLVAWGDRWMVDDAGGPIELVHRSCGHQITPVLTCPECHAAVSARDMLAQPGPAIRARGPHALFAHPRAATIDKKRRDA
jgi:DNA-binding HxlR family transcriptional regulator